jgi:hypothetical protein
MSLRDLADAQAVLDLARAAGPVEHFAFPRRKLSEVFRDAVGPGSAPAADADANTGTFLGSGTGARAGEAIPGSSPDQAGGASGMGGRHL